jgi:L-alanine-DL-glutamate epimerase-like enolase superfamily enzyme
MMKNEKPGGLGERSVAVGVLDMALWDAVAKAEGVPLWRLLADRYNNGNADKTAWVYAAGGYYYPEKDIQGLQDEMKYYLDLGYSTVKMKIGGVPLKDDLKRIEAALKVVGGKLSDVVKINNYLTDMTHIAIFRTVRDAKLNMEAPPASTTVAISQLARPGALFEIEAVAVLPPAKARTRTAARGRGVKKKSRRR